MKVHDELERMVRTNPLAVVTGFAVAAGLYVGSWVAMATLETGVGILMLHLIGVI